MVFWCNSSWESLSSSVFLQLSATLPQVSLGLSILLSNRGQPYVGCSWHSEHMSHLPPTVHLYLLGGRFCIFQCVAECLRLYLAKICWAFCPDICCGNVLFVVCFGHLPGYCSLQKCWLKWCSWTSWFWFWQMVLRVLWQWDSSSTMILILS